MSGSTLRHPAAAVGYAELHALSNFSFLRGASHPAELIGRAHALGYRALALTDECSLAGVVRAHEARCDLERAASAASTPAATSSAASSATVTVPTVAAAPFKLIIGAQFRTACGLTLVLLAPSQQAYGQICRLITLGRRRSPKGEYHLTRADFESGLSECLALWVPPASAPQASAQAMWLREFFPGRGWVAVQLHRDADDAARLSQALALAAAVGLRAVAAGDVHMHVRARRMLQDTLTAIRHGHTLDTAGRALYPNGERHLRSLRQLRALYPPALLAESVAIAERCDFSLSTLRYEYPAELVPAGRSASEHLAALTGQGMARRWPHGVPPAVRSTIERELALIAELHYEHFFLTVEDIVRYARDRGILCQGRGSAANSAVCYALGITEIDPARMQLLFERFISRERNEPPDIDVDFEHERREEVMQYIYRKYGRERAALAATVICYRTRSAIRDVARALGVPPADITPLTRLHMWSDRPGGLPPQAASGLPLSAARLALLAHLVRELVGFPRHLSQHVGGFVISGEPLATLVPIENAAMAERTVIQWDKDDLESLGLLKVDVLALGMLTALRRCFALLQRHCGRRLTMAAIPPKDSATFDMICRGETVGVFQIESRAQMSMLPRLQPRNFYDLVIEVAIVRPGPIQGDMVHPYLQRRMHPGTVHYPSKALEAVLKRTLGVPIFQEQVMQIAVVAAGFTPGEADGLRRAMAAWKRRGGLEPYRERLLSGMAANGYASQFAEQIYKQILGFGEYGFPECVVGETRVVDADSGRWLRVDAIHSGKASIKHTFACDENLKLCKRRVVAVVASGTKAVWRLRTALGHSIVASAEHPFLTLSGWRTLGGLRSGDHIAAARSIPRSGNLQWPEHQITVLADLIAEGNLCHPNTFYFYTTAAWHCAAFVRAVEKFPNTRAVVGRHRSCFSVRVRRIDRRQPAGAVLWLRELGVWGKSAREKRLPVEVFELTDEGVALLLARLWEGDGSFSTTGSASYDTASHELGIEVQHLLLRLGIVACVYCRRRLYKGKPNEHYVVTVTGGETLQRFWKKIGCRFMIRRERDEALCSSELLRLAESDIYWDRVVSIEPLGEQPTYDLQIEADHNFLANNLIVHNSHAASFALLTYISSWLKCHEPAAFAAALINSQPMGFYAPAQLTQEARRNGVIVLPVDVTVSEWDCTLEAPPAPPASELLRRAGPAARAAQPALRLGLRLVRALAQIDGERIVAARTAAPFADIDELAVRAQLSQRALQSLAAAGALAALSRHRHEASWQALGVERLPGLLQGLSAQEPPLELPPATEGQQILADYRQLGLTTGRHPLALLRARLMSYGFSSSVDLQRLADGSRVRVGGLVTHMQQPATASGVVFASLEDEGGILNIILWPSVFATQRSCALQASLLVVDGTLQRRERVAHVVAQQLHDRSAWLGGLQRRSRDFH
jgi:error-prone DNA polymerase